MAIEIVATEALFALIKSDSALLTDLGALPGTRLAVEHRFGEPSGWVKGQKCMTLRRDVGEPDLFLERDRSRYEARLYAPTEYDREKLFNKVKDLTRRTDRAVVTTTLGKAVITEFELATNPTPFYDADLDDTATLFFLNATVSEESVP